MDKYKKHFLLDLDTVIDFIKDRTDYFDNTDILNSFELSDGNINYVFKIVNQNGKSLVVKQADKYLRSNKRLLDIDRNRIEYSILKLQGEICEHYVPKVYYYDEIMCALVMEDISSFENLRYGLIGGSIYPSLANDISTFMAETLFSFSDFVLSRSEKKNRVKQFINIEMCDISEDLVFTEPYYDYKNRNIITKGNESFVVESLYNDEKLKSEIGYLRDNFMNNTQSLLHGDLHSGSIFANKKGLKVIDPEFAFYGPMGYDIGNVIGNLFFNLVYHKFVDLNDKMVEFLELSIENIFDLTFQKFNELFDSNVKLPLYNELFKIKYFKGVKQDTLGYAATEIIRRSVGDSKVKELSLIGNSELKVKIERILINFSKDLIFNREKIENGKEIIELFNKWVGC